LRLAVPFLSVYRLPRRLVCSSPHLARLGEGWAACPLQAARLRSFCLTVISAVVQMGRALAGCTPGAAGRCLPALSDFAREVTYVDMAAGVLVAEVATLVYISPMFLTCSLNESVCALTNSAWILTTSSKFLAWLSF
jgi:hypothetical protein